jgi:hypothetical protein
VQLIVRVRQFFCDVPTCPIFNLSLTLQTRYLVAGLSRIGAVLGHGCGPLEGVSEHADHVVGVSLVPGARAASARVDLLLCWSSGVFPCGVAGYQSTGILSEPSRGPGISAVRPKRCLRV